MSCVPLWASLLCTFASRMIERAEENTAGLGGVDGVCCAAAAAPEDRK